MKKKQIKKPKEKMPREKKAFRCGFAAGSLAVIEAEIMRWERHFEEARNEYENAQGDFWKKGSK